MSQQIKFGAELSSETHRLMHIEKAKRGLKLKDVYEQAVLAWIADPEGIALKLLRAYHDDSRESARTFRTAFARYQSELEAGEGHVNEQEATQSFTGSDRKRKKAGNAGRT